MSDSKPDPLNSGLTPSPPEPGASVGPPGTRHKGSWVPSVATMVFTAAMVTIAVIVVALNAEYLPSYMLGDRIAIAGVEAETFVGIGILAEVYLHWLDRINPVQKVLVGQSGTSAQPATSQPAPPSPGPPRS